MSTLTSPAVSALRVGSRHYSPNYGAELVVVSRSFPIGTTDAEAIANTVPAEFVALSADGRGWVDGWHTGAECGDVVYVERHTTGGCVFHGWIDAKSRRVVQAG